MAKRAVCISCYNFYDHYMELVMDRLRELGYQCTYITSDYNHFSQQYYRIDYPDSEQVHTIGYKHSVSLRRILSHFQLAFRTGRRVEQLQPDLLFIMVPPNGLSAMGARYKKRHPQAKLILDFYDLWPETFPSDRLKRLAAPLFYLWGRLRDGGIRRADVIYTECRLYQRVLGGKLEGKDVRLFPICRAGVTTSEDPRPPKGEGIHLCYLGSVGRLLDIETLSALIGHMVVFKPVTLHIIGAGETLEELAASARNAGAEVIYHGRFYEPDRRQQVFDQCHFGINMMKTSVCVGLTMKSMDYFAGGLPILNTIEGDTRELIREYHAGIEVNRDNLAETAQAAANLSEEANAEMRRNTLRMFREHFSADHVRGLLKELE